MQIKNMPILVMGLARTGISSARFLARNGARVVATDMRGAKELAAVRESLSGLGIRWALGAHHREDFLEAELIVVSPGVPMDHPLLVIAASAGKEIISEVELASRFITAPMIAITGTNGKTTTTTITGDMVSACGFRTFVGGNIGTPLIEMVEDAIAADVVVAEISSFQLEWIRSFRPRVSALLNISEDHLDRYAGYQEYIDAKLRIFENQTETDFAVVNMDDRLVWDAAQNIKPRLFPYSRKREPEQGIFLRGSEIILRHGSIEETFPTHSILLPGVHNLENIMAALACAVLSGCEPSRAFGVAEKFRPLHHRMELVRERNGVRFYEDSKATNVGSVEKALESFHNVTLIAGGKDKGGSYAPLSSLVRERVRHLILIGEAADRMEKELGGLTDTCRAESMESAVITAAEKTKPGGVVLMSPACSSFDMFRDYEERAQRYIAAVNGLG